MKTSILSIIIFLMSYLCWSQNNIDQLMAGGLEDAQHYTEQYVSPAATALVNGLSNGWFNTAKGKKLGKFEISLIGNGTSINSGQKTFNLNVNDYNYLRFQNPNIQEMEVATALGKNDPDMNMVIHYQDKNGQNAELEIPLPQGIGNVGVDLLPSTYLQASVGLLKGTEVKLRYLPKIEMKGIKTNFYGGAIQHELTSWLIENPIIHLSVLAGFTKFDGRYYLEDNDLVVGNTKKLTANIDSWLFSGIVSTNLPIINFYGALGYYTGNAETALRGDFHINDGVLGSQTITDPFSFSQNASGIKGTLGLMLKLGFFRLNADYSFQEYNNISIGLSFGN